MFAWYTAELTAQGNGVYSGPVIQSTFSGLSGSNGMFSGKLSGTQNSNGCSYTGGFSGLCMTVGL